MANGTLPANLPAGYEALWPLFQKQVALYSYGSSSIRNETALELMEGVRFTVALGGGLNDANASFAAGRNTIERLLQKSHVLLAGVQKTALETENLSYTHTLAALPAFFAAYDRNFFPQHIPCDIDYQTALPMLEDNAQGVVWYHEYLRRLLLENQFCALFSTANLNTLLWGAYPALADDLVNLFTPVLLAATALQLLGRDIKPLSMDEPRRAELLRSLKGMGQPQLEASLTGAALQLCAAHFPGNNALSGYIQQVVARLTPGIFSSVKASRIASLFPSPVSSLPAQEDAEYEDGALLPARRLRAIIEEAQDCRFTADKLAILQREIHSLRDFTDFLDNCLDDEECPPAFAMLSPIEVQALCKRLAAEQPNDPPRWGRLLLAWLRTAQ